jgi:hypothetical protein
MEPQIIKSKLEELPEDLRNEVYDFMEFLLQKHGSAKAKKGNFKFDWEGGLSDLKEKYTSVELQHKSLEWR